MAGFRIHCFDSPMALPAVAGAWDDLWRRSSCDRREAKLPTGRADLVAQWIEQFAPQKKFTAVAVEADGVWVAALPLVERRMARVAKAGALPSNAWCWAGDLLIDPAADVAGALAALLNEARRHWPLLRFDAVPLDAPRWQQMFAALDACGFTHQKRERFQIGTVEIAEQFHYDWEAYRASWSGNHRRHMTKALRRAQEEGGVELDIRRPHDAEEVAAMLREGFEVEHRSWKGRHGSSVIANEVMLDFYTRQAIEIAKAGELELVFLRHQGQAIAFEYGWNVAGVYFSPKVGYDEAYSRLSPGQLLRYLYLEQAFANTNCRAVDFLGPLCDATAKWSTRCYTIGSVVASSGTLPGRLWLWTYRRASEVRQWLQSSGFVGQANPTIPLPTAARKT